MLVPPRSLYGGGTGVGTGVGSQGGHSSASSGLGGCGPVAEGFVGFWRGEVLWVAPCVGCWFGLLDGCCCGLVVVRVWVWVCLVGFSGWCGLLVSGLGLPANRRPPRLRLGGLPVTARGQPVTVSTGEHRSWIRSFGNLFKKFGNLLNNFQKFTVTVCISACLQFVRHVAPPPSPPPILVSCSSQDVRL